MFKGVKAMAPSKRKQLKDKKVQQFGTSDFGLESTKVIRGRLKGGTASANWSRKTLRMCLHIRSKLVKAKGI